MAKLVMRRGAPSSGSAKTSTVVLRPCRRPKLYVVRRDGTRCEWAEKAPATTPSRSRSPSVSRLSGSTSYGLPASHVAKRRPCQRRTEVFAVFLPSPRKSSRSGRASGVPYPPKRRRPARSSRASPEVRTTRAAPAARPPSMRTAEMAPSPSNQWPIALAADAEAPGAVAVERPLEPRRQGASHPQRLERVLAREVLQRAEPRRPAGGSGSGDLGRGAGDDFGAEHGAQDNTPKWTVHCGQSRSQPLPAFFPLRLRFSTESIQSIIVCWNMTPRRSASPGHVPVVSRCSKPRYTARRCAWYARSSASDSRELLGGHGRSEEDLEHQRQAHVRQPRLARDPRPEGSLARLGHPVRLAVARPGLHRGDEPLLREDLELPVDLAARHAPEVADDVLDLGGEVRARLRLVLEEAEDRGGRRIELERRRGHGGGSLGERHDPRNTPHRDPYG